MAPAFVLDASVVMSWFFEDACDGYADAVLESLNALEAVAPAVWPLEVGNVLVVAERNRRSDMAASRRFLSVLASLPIRVEQESPSRMLKEILLLAREHKLTTYDASCLDLAMRLGLPMASQDAALCKAARRCGIPAFHPAVGS